MSRPQRNALLILVSALALGVVWLAWWTLRASDSTELPPHAILASKLAVSSPEPPALDAPGMPPSQLEAVVPVQSDSTVVFPLVIDLRLMQSSVALHADGAPALGSAATARLRGSIQNVGRADVSAWVSFIAGANQGRVLYVDRTGTFGANDLYPGLALVEVRGPAIPGSVREVRLRQERDSQLNLAYGRTAIVHGEVLGPGGTGLADARVTMDGQVTTSDATGAFVFDHMAAGEVLVIVDKPGYASYRETITTPAGRTIEPGKLKYALQPGARIEITVAEAINPGLEAQVLILPSNPRAQRRFPWFKINPVRVYPGGTTTVEDLPAEAIDLRLFHVGARAEPSVRTLTLQAGESASVTLHLAPAPQLAGTVVQGGRPVPGAHVRLEAPDRVQATLAALNVRDYLLIESELFPNLPTAVQETVSDGSGQFWLTANEDVSTARYLVATSPDGKQSGGVVLHGGETNVSVELSASTAGDAELVVKTNTRYQALPLKITVDGAPRERTDLPPGQDLRIEGLTPGLWGLRVRWADETLVEDQVIEVKRSVTWSIVLPQGAIDGQDPEIRKRAGKQ